MGNIRDELGGPDPAGEDVLKPGAEKKGPAPKARSVLAGQEVNVTPEAAAALRHSAKEGLAAARGKELRGDDVFADAITEATRKAQKAPAVPPVPAAATPGAGEPSASASDAAATAPWYRRAWEWLKGQQGPSI